MCPSISEFKVGDTPDCTLNCRREKLSQQIGIFVMFYYSIIEIKT